jgi:predicted RNA-binding Zn ribbon-like protein
MPATARAPASAPLLGEPLPVELMNTLWADRDGVHDALPDAAGLTAWLSAIARRPELADLAASPRDDPAAVAEYRVLRDALRALAAYSTGDKRPIAAHADAEGALAVLNRASALAPSWPELEWDSKLGPRPRTRCDNTTAMAVLSRMAGQAISLFSAPGRAELRACYGPGCVLYFVRDHPRREWCSPVCGNRARVARHYARHRRNSTT